MFVPNPHLPTAPVTLCAVGAGNRFLFSELSQCGIGVLPIHSSPRLPSAVADHPDLRMLHLGGEEALVEQGDARLLAALQAHGLDARYIETPTGPSYPQDVALDLAIVGGHLVYGREPLAPSIQSFCTERGLQTISTAQGYAKCSICVVAEHALITSDPSIAAGVRRYGLDVLQIRPGFIRLPGYSYGFIGGCSGKLSRDVLAFAGNIALHPDYQAIRSFCQNYRVALYSLSSSPLTDVGGILPLKQV